MSVDAYGEVKAERQRQDAKWGHVEAADAFVYATVLAEECGELARAVHDVRYAGADRARVREEAIQVAAVAVQIVERIDRGAISW